LKTLVNIPGRQNLDIAVYESKVPKPDEVTILSPRLLKVVVKLGEEFRDIAAKWAIGGDSGELIKGVHVKTDFIEVWTTKEGVDEICDLLQESVTSAPATLERKLPREADVDAKMFPVYVKSYSAELTIDGVKVEVHGDQQIKVGEWDWGDPLDFEPDYSYVVTEKIPIVPLRLKQELDLGLGWLDRLELIATALASGQHHLAQGGVRPGH
jgi:hypothetical protein